MPAASPAVLGRSLIQFVDFDKPVSGVVLAAQNSEYSCPTPSLTAIADSNHAVAHSRSPESAISDCLGKNQIHLAVDLSWDCPILSTPLKGLSQKLVPTLNIAVVPIACARSFPVRDRARTTADAVATSSPLHNEKKFIPLDPLVFRLRDARCLEQ